MSNTSKLDSVIVASRPPGAAASRTTGSSLLVRSRASSVRVSKCQSRTFRCARDVPLRAPDTAPPSWVQAMLVIAASASITPVTRCARLGTQDGNRRSANGREGEASSAARSRGSWTIACFYRQTCCAILSHMPPGRTRWKFARGSSWLATTAPPAKNVCDVSWNVCDAQSNRSVDSIRWKRVPLGPVRGAA
jgi:hypothetical protein